MTENLAQPQPPLSDEELGLFRQWVQRDQQKRIIIGITGASGVQYGIRLLEILSQQSQVETHLVVSDNAHLVMRYELDYTEDSIESIMSLANFRYHNRQMEAAISSGSFKTVGMIVAPCNVKTLEHIAHASDETLIDRAAFCCLKEGRRLVLIPRETPATLSYLENLLKAKRNGADILLPVPAFYHKPRTVDDIINQTVQKALDLFNIEANLFRRWETPLS